MAENKVKNDNYIVIQGWMIKELKLKGNELVIYAIIYGFSQAEEQVFSGSLQYLADWTNTTKRNVMNCLKSLEEKGYIGKNEKFINGVKFCEYYRKNFTGVEKNFLQGGEKISIPTMEKNSPNNIGLDTIENNIDNNKEESHTNKNFIKPTLEEVKAYCKERNNYIDAEYFIDYYNSNGWKVNKNPMKDWKAAIRNWERRKNDFNNKKKESKKTGKFDDVSAYYESNNNAPAVKYNREDLDF